MALTDENGMVMPVTPMNNGGGFGGGLFGGDLSIIVLFFLFMMLGGWGNGFGGGFGGGDLYPWMNNSNQMASGFQNQMLNDNITGIQNSINGITSQLSTNQMADMERSFSVQSALQNCCCENRASIADLKYTVATEACADRAAVSDALRTVIAEGNANTQRILDRLCQQEIDALKSQNAALQTQVNMQALAASQTAQTAALVADNTAQTQYLVNRIAPYPIPSYTVTNPTTPAA